MVVFGEPFKKKKKNFTLPSDFIKKYEYVKVTKGKTPSTSRIVVMGIGLMGTVG